LGWSGAPAHRLRQVIAVRSVCNEQVRRAAWSICCKLL